MYKRFMLAQVGVHAYFSLRNPPPNHVADIRPLSTTREVFFASGLVYYNSNTDPATAMFEFVDPFCRRRLVTKGTMTLTSKRKENFDHYYS